MTATTHNVPRVLAQCLRASTAQLRRVGRRVDAEAEAIRAASLETIDAVAEELEAAPYLSAAPDPAGGPPCRA